MPTATSDADRQAQFLRLFLSTERELFRYVAVIAPSVEDASEIVQQTALLLWAKFDQYDASQPFAPWACRFALNVARQWIASRRRWASVLESETSEELLARRAELLPDLDRRLRHLESCLEKLTAEQRSLIDRYYWRREGVSVISQEQRLSVEAVYKSLQRIRQRLRACIDVAIQSDGSSA